MSDIRPRDHLEVRLERTNALIGWLKHQSPDLIDRWSSTFIVPEPAEITGSFDYVEEDADGSKTVHVGLVGAGMELKVLWHRYECPELTMPANVTAEVPSYAKQVYKPVQATNLFEWPALVASIEDAEELFDHELFEPNDPSPSIPEIVALDDEAKWHDPIRSLLRPATPAPNVIDAHKILSTTKAITGSDIVAGTVSAKSLSVSPRHFPLYANGARS